jgi:hypothetical protein
VRPSGAPLTAEEEQRLLIEEAALEAQLKALADSAALPDSDAAALSAEELIEAQARSAERFSTRASTHVGESQWFAAGASEPAAVDVRQRLSWRFKSASAAYRMLGPIAPAAERRELVALLRDYEVALRAAASEPPAGTKQLTDALHAQLAKTAIDHLDKLLTRIEDKLLAVDETVGDEAFRMRWTKERDSPKGLLRYARLLASRRFNVGFRRDRFEALAQELLTARAPSGQLLLMPRSKAGPVLQQLLRGLSSQPAKPQDRSAAISYLRDALDRLQSLAGARQFFDSGFFVDVHGYKVTMHDRITHPEFLFLCVALNVEIHNRLRQWSDPKSRSDGSSPPPLASLQAQLRAQEQSVHEVFGNFRKPRELTPVAPGSGQPTSRKAASKKPSRVPASGGHSVLLFVIAGLFMLGALGANLVTTGVITLKKPAQVVSQSELRGLSPLLLRGSLSADGSRFDGLISRPIWQQLDPKQRRARADQLALRLSKLGVQQARLFAYKTRAIEVESGRVVYVDDAR